MDSMEELRAQLEALRKQNEMLQREVTKKVNYTRFSREDIERAISKYGSQVLGDGAYGVVYKGELLATTVAIKKIKEEAKFGEQQFQQEIDILCEVRHPNLVTLIGACPDEWALVYEFLPGGTLDDRLACRNEQKPLRWDARMHIASEICTVLVFLHSREPGIVHGDLKPTNILFDANDVLKISDFGISRMLPKDDPKATAVRYTTPKGTEAYMDPLFRETGELTTKADVYAFGVILLRLLTNKPAKDAHYKVEKARRKNNLKDVLDKDANWPTKLADELSVLALACCRIPRRERPDLATEVLQTLERLRKEHTYEGFSLFRRRS